MGWGVHQNQPPIYQAEGVISVGIDFTRTGEMTDIEEDQLLGIVGDVAASSTVIKRVVERAQGEQYVINEEAFKEISFADRSQYRWILRIRHSNPMVAARLAEIWTEEAYEALLTALEHSIQASSLQRYLDSLESCLQKSVVASPAEAYCQLNNLPELSSVLNETGKLAIEEKIASQGVLPATTITLTSMPATPTSPVLYRQGGVILAGALAGFFVAAFIILTGWTDKIFRGRP